MFIKILRFLIFFGIIGCAIFFLFTPSTKKLAKEQLRIVCSFSILSDLVHTITEGTQRDITTLIDIDEDPHLFEPKPSDMKKISEADFVVINGLKLETWLEKGLLELDSKKLIIATKRILSKDEDPHAWHSVENVMLYVHEIVDKLSQKDHVNALLYRKNGAKLVVNLKKLHHWIQAQIRSIPKEKRVIITTHDAFSYLGSSYGIKVLSPVGTNTEVDPSPRAVSDLIRFIKENGIHAIFIESHFFPRLIEQISKETGRQIAGKLYADGLSSDAPSFDAMMRHNINKIVEGMKLNGIESKS